MSARQEIFDFVDFINSGLDGKNDLDKDFVMKSCLVLSDLDQRYKVSNFTNSNLKLIETNWKRIKVSIEATLRLVNRFGIDRENLTSAIGPGLDLVFLGAVKIGHETNRKLPHAV